MRIGTMLVLFSVVAIYAETPLQSKTLRQDTIEISAIALPGPKKKVGLKIVNSGDADIRLEGRVVATNSAKNANVASCRFTTSMPAKSDANKKITCDTTGADTLAVTIEKPAP